MPKLIIFSPLPPARNGIADYTRSLLDQHRRDFDCAVVIADGAPEPVDLPDDVAVLRDAEYTRFAKTFQDVPHLFHVGNNSGHRYMFDHLRLRSGIVVAHDLTLHHLIADTFAPNDLDGDLFVEAIWRSHGSPGRMLAEQVVEHGWHNLINHLDLNCLRFVLHRASGAISHSWLGVTRIKSLRPDLPVKHIELFAAPAEGTRASRRQLARRRLGLDPTHTIFVTLGFVTLAKQAIEIMDVLADLRHQIGHCAYLLVGESKGVAVEQEAARRGVGDLVRHLGYVEERDFPLYIDAADIVLNMRYPTFGETSSVLCRALGRGACVVVTDHGWYSELPAQVVAKVPALPGGAGQVHGVLLKLVRDPSCRRRFEIEAEAWAAAALAIERIAGDYRDFILAHLPKKQPAVGSISLIAAERPAGGGSVSGARDDSPFLGHLWRDKAVVPYRGAASKLKLSAPAGAAPRIIEALRNVIVDDTLEPGDCGLFLGSWDDVSGDSRRLSDFAALLQEDGIAVIDVWCETLGSSVDFTKAAVDAVLANLDLQVLTILAESSSLSATIDVERTEIAFLARRMTSLRSRDRAQA